jgi:hypothetical protein
MDGYNMSSAISLGNSRMGAVSNLNESIRLQNKTAIENASKAAKVAVGNDEQEGIMSGVKDALTESTAMSNFKTTLDSYNESVKNAGKPGFTEVKPTPDELKPKAAAAGEEIDELAEKPSAAITTSEGTFAEGSDVLTKGAKSAEEVGELAGKGAKVAGALGKGVGVLGGLVSSGMDIASEYESLKAGKGLAGDNFGEKLGNLATIGGTALDMLGFVPGFQLAGVIGTALQAAGGLSEAAGEAVETAKKIQTDTKPTDPPPLQQVAQASLAGSFAATR